MFQHDTKKSESSISSTTPVNEQYIRIGTLNANSPVNIGSNNIQTITITQNYDSHKIYKTILSNLLERDIYPNSIITIDSELKDLSEELSPNRQDMSTITNIIQKIKEKAVDIPLDILKDCVVGAISGSVSAAVIEGIRSLMM